MTGRGGSEQRERIGGVTGGAPAIADRHGRPGPSSFGVEAHQSCTLFCGYKESQRVLHEGLVFSPVKYLSQFKLRIRSAHTLLPTESIFRTLARSHHTAFDHYLQNIENPICYQIKLVPRYGKN